MAVTIKSQNKPFDLPIDFQIEIEITSPFYNEIGSRTTGSTLPGTKHNLSLLNHIHRMDIVDKPERDRMVMVADGVYRRSGKINVVSPLRSGISCNIGFDESLMYEAWNNVILKNLPNLPKKQFDGGLAELITHIDAVYRYQVSADYHVFPAVVSNEEVDTVVYPQFINRIIMTDEGTATVMPTFKLVTESRTENTVVGGTLASVKVPEGYGISPFLKVSKILDLIFEAYGYRLVENPFATDFQLKKMVVLNNVADAVVEGYIDYKDMMPDCTINSFLHSLFCRTGAQIFVNGNNKTAKVILLKDAITAQPTDNWTLLRATEIKPTYEAGKQLKITAPTTFNNSKPAADSFDDFYKKYAGVIQVYAKHYDYVPNEYNVAYNSVTGNYYKTELISKKTEWLSSDFFPWDKKHSELSYEEISGDDESVPMGFANEYILCPHYLAGASHYHTTFRSTSVSDEETSETPLAFCFAIGMGRYNANTQVKNRSGYYHGSTLCIDLDGEPFVDPNGNQYYFSLVPHGKYGSFFVFFKDWDAILRHANHIFEGEINLTKNQLTMIDTSRPILISGQKLMIDKVKHSLPSTSDSPAKVTFRSIKLLKPFNLTEEQHLPEMIAQQTKWVIVSYIEQAYLAKKKTVSEQYDKPTVSTAWDFRYEITTEPTNDEFAFYLPPTALDVANGREILNTYQAKIHYKVTYISTSFTTTYSESIIYYAGIKASVL